MPRNPSIKKFELDGTTGLIGVVGELNKLAKLLLTKLVVVMDGPVIGIVDPLRSKSPSKSSKFEAAGAVEALEVTTGAVIPLSKLSKPPSRLSNEFCRDQDILRQLIKF